MQGKTFTIEEIENKINAENKIDTIIIDALKDYVRVEVNPDIDHANETQSSKYLAYIGTEFIDDYSTESEAKSRCVGDAYAFISRESLIHQIDEQAALQGHHSIAERLANGDLSVAPSVAPSAMGALNFTHNGLPASLGLTPSPKPMQANTSAGPAFQTETMPPLNFVHNGKSAALGLNSSYQPQTVAKTQNAHEDQPLNNSRRLSEERTVEESNAIRMLPMAEASQQINLLEASINKLSASRPLWEKMADFIGINVRPSKQTLQIQGHQQLLRDLRHELGMQSAVNVQPANQNVSAPAALELTHWKTELERINKNERRPFSGSEFKQAVLAVETSSRGADEQKARAREAAGLLARVHGDSTEALFIDPELRQACKEALTAKSARTVEPKFDARKESKEINAPSSKHLVPRMR